MEVFYNRKAVPNARHIENSSLNIKRETLSRRMQSRFRIPVEKPHPKGWSKQICMVKNRIDQKD
jgi:hypothetical protein